jgi:hypothetical protein
MRINFGLASASLAMALTGCGMQPPNRAYEGPERPDDQIALLYPDWLGALRVIGANISIASVDDRPVPRASDSVMVGVPPGPHVVDLMVSKTEMAGGGFLRTHRWTVKTPPFEARAGYVHSVCLTPDGASVIPTPVRTSQRGKGDLWQAYGLKPCEPESWSELAAAADRER